MWLFQLLFAELGGCSQLHDKVCKFFKFVNAQHPELGLPRRLRVTGQDLGIPVKNSSEGWQRWW